MADLELHVSTDGAQKVARLKLSRADGEHLGANEIRLPEHSSVLWEGLFDTRRYIDRYAGALRLDGQAEPASAEDLLQRLGRFLGEEVLGEQITRVLSRPGRQVLVVRLPTTDRDLLAAAFARVPWEIARLSDGTRPRNLVVRALTEDRDRDDPGSVAEALHRGETLRVLAVFAEAPGSRPLAMRREREELRRLFADKILPKRRVEIDLLCHGVTRRRLKEQIRARRGYHLVHWSGHGHHNTLELQGEPDNRISGEDLVELFTEAGGFIPRVFFLSACHSGSMIQVKDWEGLQRLLQQDEQGPGPGRDRDRADATAEREAAEPKQLDDAFKDPSGYTGTALELLKAGVPQVVAMRYAVGDEYARRLALAFYLRLLGERDIGSADEALAIARSDVVDDPEQGAYYAVNHATPLMFGQPGVLLQPEAGRSPQMERLRPRPWPLLSGGRTELDPPAGFVGRGEPLTRLGDDWLGDDGPAVALIQGLAGLGKTALAAELIHLWHERFDYVLAFQAKPSPLQLDDLMRRLDQRLTLESPSYRERCRQNDLNHIHLSLDPSRDPRLFAEPGSRHQRMRANLLEALRDESVLLVLDNLERNLETIEGVAGSALYACADPAWDDLLRELARELPATRSRLLVTSRHRPGALVDAAATLWIPLGPLPIGEAALFVRGHPDLRPLVFSNDPADQALIHRLLTVSRGHPLILDRLARLAADPADLTAALDRVQAEGWQRLPDLFGGSAGDQAEQEAERAYLEDVAIGSVDLLIERLTPDARRLLRVVTLANEPVSEGFIDGVWRGQSAADKQLDQLGQMLGQLDQMAEDDPRKQQILDFLATDQGKELMERLKSRTPQPESPPVAPLLDELRGSGLLTQEEPEQGQATYGFHELVRERIAHWRSLHADATDDRDDDAIRIGYGERYAGLFDDLYQRDRQVAGEAGRRALVYFVRAQAFERLGSFAGNLVTGVNDPGLMRDLVTEMEGAIDQAPPGKQRWSLRTYVADALGRAGQPDRALPFYTEAAAEAEAAEHWSDVAWITGNWAIAARYAGDLTEAKRLNLRSAEAANTRGQRHRSRAGGPAHRREARRSRGGPTGDRGQARPGPGLVATRPSGRDRGRGPGSGLPESGIGQRARYRLVGQPRSQPMAGLPGPGGRAGVGKARPG